MVCYFIEVAFINILEVFIRKTTGAERRVASLGRELSLWFQLSLPSSMKYLLLGEADLLGVQ